MLDLDSSVSYFKFFFFAKKYIKKDYFEVGLNSSLKLCCESFASVEAIMRQRQTDNINQIKTKTSFKVLIAFGTGLIWVDFLTLRK
jgi:hypothetical protein